MNELEHAQEKITQTIALLESGVEEMKNRYAVAVSPAAKDSDKEVITVIEKSIVELKRQLRLISDANKYVSNTMPFKEFTYKAKDFTSPIEYPKEKVRESRKRLHKCIHTLNERRGVLPDGGKYADALVLKASQYLLLSEQTEATDLLQEAILALSYLESELK